MFWLPLQNELPFSIKFRSQRLPRPNESPSDEQLRAAHHPLGVLNFAALITLSVVGSLSVAFAQSHVHPRGSEAIPHEPIGNLNIVQMPTSAASSLRASFEGGLAMRHFFVREEAVASNPFV
jgi:hypothetical protein